MNDQKVVYIIQKDIPSGEMKHRRIVTLTSRHHDIKILNLEQALDEDFSSAIMLIVDVAPDNYDTVTALKYILRAVKEKAIPFLFVLGSMARTEIIQAQKLGPSDFTSHPVNPKDFIDKIEKIANNSIEKSWENLSKIQSAALKVSLKVFEDTFSNATQGMPLSNEELKESCDLIIEATASDGLSTMLSSIRTHHNYTYRHSMMVCGYLTTFSLMLGITGHDLQNLTACGLIHDIGKARVPLELLDKPSALNEAEWVEMRMHAEHSKEILKNSKFHPDIIDGAVHHHEKLDGSGYPDGLRGPQMRDISRMVAIADIFSGLTEKRSYKKSMTNKKALDIMFSMEGHLDMDLLNVFKPIALNMD